MTQTEKEAKAEARKAYKREYMRGYMRDRRGTQPTVRPKGSHTIRDERMFQRHDAAMRLLRGSLGKSDLDFKLLLMSYVIWPTDEMENLFRQAEEEQFAADRLQGAA